MLWFKATGEFNPNQREAGVVYPADAPRVRLLVKYAGAEKRITVADDIRVHETPGAHTIVAYDYTTGYWFGDVTAYALLTPEVLGEA